VNFESLFDINFILSNCLLFLRFNLEFMKSSYDKFEKRRLMTSYFSVVLSIFLVLFMLGLLVFFVVKSKKLTNDFKEQIVMTVFFKNDATKDSIKDFGVSLRLMDFTKRCDFVSKEQAAKEHKEILGEDFVKFLGVNPLQNSFDIHLKADYINKESIERIERKLKSNEMVADVVFPKEVMADVNEKVQKISVYIFVISGIFALISILLINSSLRLSIHANRFIIKTMQMVGATKSFIRKPFILQSIKLGLIGSGLAIVALVFTLIYIENSLQLGLLEDKIMILLISLWVVIAGVLITWLSTHFATQRFLNLRTDDLY
jgi:cell division transport system permease protein